jgi:hypothetical protein
MHRVAGYAEYPTLGMQSVFLDESSETIEGDEYAQNIFTTTADARWLLIIVAAQATYDDYFNLIQKLQVEESNGRTSYEPYGYKIPISSANITTPVYLGEVPTVRMVKKLVLDGTENWALSASRIFYTPIARTAYNNSALILCSHFEKYSDNPNLGVAIANVGTQLRLYDVNSVYSDVTAFTTYLQQQYAAGTPVTVWYVLATPQTAVVNEPLMKIGNYADTVSYEQAGVQIPTNRGNTVIDVLTELKPSEVYIKYKG